MEKAPEFGRNVWTALANAPFGSLAKRELELILLKAAIDAGAVSPTPAAVASTFRMTLVRAQSYLTDIALREEPYDDKGGVRKLLASLKAGEAVASERHISFPISDQRLSIWLERKMSEQGLHPGDMVSRATARVTIPGLLKLLDNNTNLMTPIEAIARLEKQYGEEDWFLNIRHNSVVPNKWLGFLKAGGSAISNINDIFELIQKIPNFIE
jgi:hypothetical protein